MVVLTLLANALRRTGSLMDAASSGANQQCTWIQSSRSVAGSVLMGCTVVLPACALVAQLVTRFVVRSRRIRQQQQQQWWSTLGSAFLVVVIGDILVEVWMVAADPSTMIPCSRSYIILALGIRLIFIIGGVYVGQSFKPVALTGSIATGKSTVSSLFEKSNSDSRLKSTGKRRRSFRIVDTDKIGHQILLFPEQLSRGCDNNNEPYVVSASESVYTKIVATFGDASVNNKNILTEDGQIDRRKLGDIIFPDSQKRRQLNSISRPRILRSMIKQILHNSYVVDFGGPKRIVCADVPLLFESGTIRWMFCLVIVVACDPDIQYQRLRQRNPDLTEQQSRDRIASQFPIHRKVDMADIVIWNNGSLGDLSAQVDRVKKEVEDRLFGGLSMSHCVVVLGGVQLMVMAFHDYL